MRVAWLLVAWALVLVQPAAGSEPIELLVRFPPESLLAGEPVFVDVEIRLLDPQAGQVFVTSKSFLAVEVFDENGVKLEISPGSQELYYELEEKRPWLWGTVILTDQAPSWSKTISLREKYDLSGPGRYDVVVRWGTPPLDSRQEEEILQELAEEHPKRSATHFLKGLKEVRRQTVEVVCPRTEADRGAYRLVSGGECPDSRMSVMSVTLRPGLTDQLLDHYPKSRYAGYVLAKGKRAFPYGRVLGDWENADEFVRRLGSGSFLSDHPEVTMFLELPQVKAGRVQRTERVASELVVRKHYVMVTEFLALHQDFPLRDKLEAMVALDALALGNAAEARRRWRWVETHSTDEKRAAQATQYTEATERTGLVETSH